MRIIEHYSHFNGYEHILVHKPQLWQEIETVINAVDASLCYIKISQDKQIPDHTVYNFTVMNRLFHQELAVRSWHESPTSYLFNGTEHHAILPNTEDKLHNRLYHDLVVLSIHT